MARHEVKFVAKKPVKVPKHVAFYTKAGEPVRFNAHEIVKEPVVVDFEAKNKK